VHKFKSINDTYGHIIGDDVIKHFSSLIKKTISPNNRAFRIGGDEFAIIFQSTGNSQARILVEKMRQVMKDNYYKNTLDDIQISYTTSIGFASYEMKNGIAMLTKHSIELNATVKTKSHFLKLDLASLASKANQR